MNDFQCVEMILRLILGAEDEVDQIEQASPTRESTTRLDHCRLVIWPEHSLAHAECCGLARHDESLQHQTLFFQLTFRLYCQKTVMIF